MNQESRAQELLQAYEEHADALFRFCYAQTSQRELARDMVQETFIRSWKYLAGGGRIERMRPFLYRTARNAIIDHVRRSREQSLDALKEAGWDAPDSSPDPLLTAEAAHAVRLAAQLDEPYREALLMRYVDELMPREISAITGESENVISVRIHRALEQLRTLMGKTP